MPSATEPNFRFPSDAAILVTGAGSGIGRATAIRAAQMGLAVSAWDLNPSGLAETVATIAESGAPVHSWVGDVSDERIVADGFASANAALGPIGLLHNNAGPPSSTPIDFDRAISICLGSVRRMTETWAAAQPGPGASMVVTVSVAGNLIGTESDWYSSAKAGLMGYVRHLAAHRAPAFRSNGVAPGMTDTPRLAAFTGSEIGQQALLKNPMRRMATPDDIAFATLFLLSPLASYINGAFLPVDGGWTVTQ